MLCFCTMCMPGPCQGQKGASEPLELELWRVVSHTWVLAIKPASSAGTSMLNCWAILQALEFTFEKPIYLTFVYVCMSMYTCVQVQAEDRSGTGPPTAVTPGICELPDMSAEKQTPVLYKSTACSSLPSHLLSPHSFYFKTETSRFNKCEIMKYRKGNKSVCDPFWFCSCQQLLKFT